MDELADLSERPEGGERKRFYRISAEGRRALAAEARRLEGLVAVSRDRLRGEAT